MGLTINKLRDAKVKSGPVVAQERMFLTADRSRVVGEGDSDAKILYAAPGHRLPAAAVIQFNLAGGWIKGQIPAWKKAEIAREKEIKKASDDAAKQAAKPADKRRKGGRDKKG